MSELTDKANEKLAEVREKTEEAVATARAKAADAARDARARAREARDKARQQAGDARAKAKTGIEQNPIVALAGGLAIGAIAAALLPRTAREDRLVGPVGKKVRETAKSAARAAQVSGKEQLNLLGVNSDTARDQVKDLVGKLAKAATSAAAAAGESVKKR